MLNALFFELVIGLLFLLPATALIYDFVRERREDAARAVAPFDDLQRRPAGESTRLKLEAIAENIDVYLAWILIVPIALAVALSLQPRHDLVLIAGFFLMVVVVTAIAQRKLRPLRRKRRAYQLGFQGERYVAEELNQLLADGFQVFHDVPFEKFNIDHVLIGPRGVFVVETKTRRKKAAHGDQKHIVLFDGDRLNFRSGWDTDALEQARRNAKTLSQWLTSSTADKIPVRAILTIPGWWVERSAKSDVFVSNPKQIKAHVLSFAENQLSADIIQRAKYQLEQRCRLPVT